MATRREALGTAAGAAVTLSLAGALPAQAAPGDAAVLVQVSRVELALRYAYQQVANAQLDAPELQTIAMEFDAQEGEHLSALATSLEALGSPRPEPLRSIEDLQRAADALEIGTDVKALTEPDDVAGFLLDLERASAKTLELAAARLSDMNLMQTSLSILGCQAQHAAVLRRFLGRGPVGLS